MKSTPQTPLWPHSAVILAGGLSTRMKQPKEGVLLPDGKTFLAHLIRTLRCLCSQIIVVGSCKGYNLASEPSIIHIQDKIGGKGPLSGLHAALESQLDSCYLVITCDQPLLTVSILDQLTNVASHYKATVFSLDGIHIEPFPGCYPAQLFPLIDDAMGHQNYSVTRLLESTPVAINKIKLGQEFLPCIKSINTPEDLSWASQFYSEKFQYCGEALAI